jgi:hypothetical protein
MSRPTALRAALERGDQIIVAVDELLKRQSHRGGTRVGLVLAFLSMVMEHHLAFLLLVRSSYFGAALALMRSQIESLIRMLWIARCATDYHVKQIGANKDYEFPPTRLMAETIDTVYRTGGFFVRLKKGAWNHLCDYTHTGMRQVFRRFKGRTIEPNYSPQSMLTATNMVNAAMLMAGAAVFELMGYQDELKEVKRLMAAYDLLEGPVR